MRDITEGALKRRIKEHVDGLKDWKLARVARETGDDYKQVLRWVTGDTTVPADFIARFVAHVPEVDPHWLLTGEKPMGKEEARTAPLDEWGLARARAVEKLADLLLADQAVLEKRAEAALEAGRAARIEAEKAPDRSKEATVLSVAEMMTAIRHLEAEESKRNPRSGGGEGPQSRHGG